MQQNMQHASSNSSSRANSAGLLLQEMQRFVSIPPYSAWRLPQCHFYGRVRCSTAELQQQRVQYFLFVCSMTRAARIDLATRK
jgi:hypothetical protein